MLVGGTLLLTPGLLTDLVGFGLIVPHTRRLVLEAIKRRWDLAHGIVEVEVVDLSRWEE